MNRYPIFLAALSVAGSASAKCVYRPHIEAEVLVTSCQSVVFGASKASFAGFNLGGSPLYKEGSTLSGTFLSVTVQKSWFVWSDLPDHRTNGLHTWNKGKAHSLFIAEPAGSTCAVTLPITLKVITTDVCCDTLPRHDECLVPKSVIRVKLASP